MILTIQQFLVSLVLRCQVFPVLFAEDDPDDADFEPDYDAASGQAGNQVIDLVCYSPSVLILNLWFLF